LDGVIQTGPHFGAIVVDEGQDFGDEWWTVLEACLADDQSYLYIFFDDQQSLLPRGASYPIDMPPVDLSRNCRNAGQIYAAMRVLSPYAPDPEDALATLGHATFVLGEAGLQQAVVECLNWLTRHEALHSFVAVLGGGKSFDESVLARGFPHRTAADWRKEVIAELVRIARRSQGDSRVDTPSEARLRRRLSKLSHASLPTTDDIALVGRVSRGLKSPRADRKAPHDGVGWWPDTWGEPRGFHIEPSWGYDQHVLSFLETGRWAETLPSDGPFSIGFAPHRGCPPNARPVYAVGEFKGLESDAVLLVMEGHAPEPRNELFVGVSRARAVLAVAMDRATARHLTAGELAALGMTGPA
jgi:hypothetical protein